MEVLSTFKTIEDVQCPVAVLLYEDDQSNLAFLKGPGAGCQAFDVYGEL
jgi:hypothetical protein